MSEWMGTINTEVKVIKRNIIENKISITGIKIYRVNSRLEIIFLKGSELEGRSIDIFQFEGKGKKD
jgi:hypothetical protein